MPLQEIIKESKEKLEAMQICTFENIEKLMEEQITLACEKMVEEIVPGESEYYETGSPDQVVYALLCLNDIKENINKFLDK